MCDRIAEEIALTVEVVYLGRLACDNAVRSFRCHLRVPSCR